MEPQNDSGAPRGDTHGAGGAQVPAAPEAETLGELCLLAALDPQRFSEELGAERAAAFCADARNAAEIAALRGFLGDVRAGLLHERQGLDSRAVRRVTRRVLARTTREERGWRGDLRLVGDFVADRLRASAWLRVAAAALFVQVTVVPILAWHMLRESREGAFQLRMERHPAPSEFDAEGAAPGADLELESPALDPTMPVLPVSEVAAGLTALGERICAEYGRGLVPPQSTREVLVSGSEAAARTNDPAERALAHRALLLASGGREAIAAQSAPLGVPGAPPATDVSRVARLVQLEQALDRRALLGHAAELSALLDAHGASLLGATPGSLEAAVQRRALALQVVAHRLSMDGAERSVSALLPDAAYGEALAEALAAEGSAPGGPWARAWLEVLAERR